MVLIQDIGNVKGLADALPAFGVGFSFLRIIELNTSLFLDRRRTSGSLDEAAEDSSDNGGSTPKKKTAIEEQWERSGGFELTSVEQETYEKYFYGTEHWNYFTNDEDLGPVILSIKQETLNSRDQFR